MMSEAAEEPIVGTHFETPCDLREDTGVPVVEHQIVINAMYDQGQVQTIEHPDKYGFEVWDINCNLKDTYHNKTT